MRNRRAMQGWTLAVALGCAVAVPSGVRAFCGFYVGGAESTLYNDGSMVVLMRDGTRTVVSMQNDYHGPPEAFALVVPVPEVLDEDMVRTLPREVFAKVDRLTAPRLVEYWEQDPCPQEAVYGYEGGVTIELASRAETDDDEGYEEEPRDLGVRVEAEFAVGEYDIVILSAEYSAGLDTWLRQNGYAIPAGAERVLRPYVEQNMKFFVAKVDPQRVTFDGESAVLSPLRFHYDAESFFLPIRLGLLNSRGQQDVIVNVLARQLRYEVANYDNFAIPTNLTVSDRVRAEFGSFYDALFTRMIEAHPGSVITEYAWGAGSCDPCPEPPLDADSIVSLGADVIPSYERAIRRGRVQTGFEQDFVVTRLHLRARADGQGEDLFFRPAPPIEGGRGTPDVEGQMSGGVQSYGVNNFQGRYAILHEWEGAIECEQPMRGRWGGPPSTEVASGQPMAATGLAFVAAGTGATTLGGYLTQENPLLGQSTDTLPTGPVAPPGPPPTAPGGCSGATCSMGTGGTATVWFVGAAALLLWGRRRR